MNLVKSNIKIPVNGVVLDAILTVPPQATAIVVFVHGSGSSRFSPRNNYVAEILQQAGLATLLFDLLTEEEDLTYENRFNIKLLTKRLEQVTEWLLKQPNTKNFKVGYFGASTGSASAIIAAAELRSGIKAVVSRGGRPDLAVDALTKITAPILLIVGGADTVVIELNQGAYDSIKGEKSLQIIPNATHLFEEPGTLEEVAKLTCAWFKKYLH